MGRFLQALVILSSLTGIACAVAAEPGRTRQLVPAGEARIDVIA